MKVALLRSTTFLEGAHGLTASSQALVQSTVRRFCRHWSTLGFVAIVKVSRRQREAHLRSAAWHEGDRAVSRLQCHAPMLQRVSYKHSVIPLRCLLCSRDEQFSPRSSKRIRAIEVREHATQSQLVESPLALLHDRQSALTATMREPSMSPVRSVNSLRSAVNAAVPRHTHAAVRMHHSLSGNAWFLIAFVSREALGFEHCQRVCIRSNDSSQRKVPHLVESRGDQVPSRCPNSRSRRSSHSPCIRLPRRGAGPAFEPSAVPSIHTIFSIVFCPNRFVILSSV